MRHTYTRGILTVIWLAAAIVSGICENLPAASLYAITGGLFACSVRAAWTKEKKDKGAD